MNFKHVLILVFSVVCMVSCTNDSENLTVVKSFIKARNNFDAAKLASMADENYKETFRNDFVEVKNRAELLRNLEWAKELSSSTTIEKVVSENDSIIILIEKSSNYIDVAFKRKLRSFKTTYYLKDKKILKQKYDFAPGETNNNKANEKLYGDFERYCKVNNISYSWNPTKKDGIILRKALEKYANR
ncbi:hypothetical protein [Kordia sp.]|uniref:hypothetical protein n=1 Tax=Kordia sp. TaxID=1965332 RepID=UPI003D6BF56A